MTGQAQAMDVANRQVMRSMDFVAGRGPSGRLLQIVTVSADWPGFPENYGAAVDGGGPSSTAPTGNSAIHIWSPSGVNCPVRMRAMG